MDLSQFFESLDYIKLSILFVTSFFANLFAAVSGGGAGFIQFPVLIILGLPFATALGTHKVAVVFLGLGSLAKKHSHYSLDRTICIILLLAGCPGAALGSLIIVEVPVRLAELTLGILTIMLACYTFFKKSYGENAIENLSTRRKIFGTLLIFLLGLFSGSFSSGTGFFATFVLTTVLGLKLKDAISYSIIFVAAVWNAIGALTLGAVTSIQWSWLPVMVIATSTGAYIGTSLLNKIKVSTVRAIIMVSAVISGILLISRAL